MITIQKEPSILTECNLRFIKSAIKTVLESLDQSNVDLTLRLTNDEEMHQMNLTYRGIDSSTDVLAFSQDYVDPDTNRRYLGDIIISVDRASDQASENHHSITEECGFLAIHGTLHLLGYDHYEPKEKAIMWALQDEIFKIVKTEFMEPEQ